MILVCRKIFSPFYPILHKTFPNSYGFPLIQYFSPFYPDCTLWYETFLFNLDWFEQPFIFVSSKVSFAKLWPEECPYKTVSKNAGASVWKCSSKAVAQRCSVKKVVLRNFAKVTGKHLCQSLFINKVAGWGLQLY